MSHKGHRAIPETVTGRGGGREGERETLTETELPSKVTHSQLNE